MRRTTPARSAHDARRPARAIHLRAASVVALAALGVGVAPAVAAPLTGTHSAIVTTDKSDAASDGGVSDGDDDQQQSTSPTEESTGSEPQVGSSAKSQEATTGASESSGKTDVQGEKATSPSATQSNNPPLKGPTSPSDGGTPTDSADPPELSLGETSVPAGKGTHLEITGFPQGSRVTVTATGPEAQGNTKFTAKLPETNKGGAASTWLKIPADAPVGKYKVIATTEDNGTSAHADLNVAKAAPDEDAVLTLTPSSVPVGQSTTISGSHFWAKGSGEGPKRAVTVELRNAKTNKVAKTLKPAMDEGTFTAEVKTSNEETPPGTYTVVATSGSAANEKTDTATLTVKGTTTPPTSDDGAPTGGMGGGSGNGTPSTDDPPSSSSTPPSSSSTPSTTPSDSGSSSASTTSEVPPTTSTRDSSKEIELSAPSDDSSPKSTEKSEEKDTSEKPTKDQDSEKAKDEDEKTSSTPQATSDQPVSQQQNDTTDVAATTEDDTTSSGPTTVTTQDDGGGPLVKLFSSIGGEDASGMNRIRQVFVATLGVAFLTAAGFTTASWLSRRSGTHSARAGLRQLFHRRH